MSGWQIGLLSGALIGLVLARWVVRSSTKQKPIPGGTLTQMLHFLGCAAQTAAAPAALIGGILSPELHFFPRLLLGTVLAFGFVSVSLLFLIALAVLELRTQPEQSG